MVFRGYLDAWNKRDSVFGSLEPGFIPASRGVVIGECQNGQSGFGSILKNLLYRLSAIGVSAVAMQIDFLQNYLSQLVQTIARSRRLVAVWRP